MTHKRFLWNGDDVPACGAATGKGVLLSDEWAIVTCTECRSTRSMPEARGIAICVVTAVVAFFVFAAYAPPPRWRPDWVFPALVVGSLAVFPFFFAIYGIVQRIVIWWRWRGADPADPPTWECGKVQPSAFGSPASLAHGYL